MQISYPFRKKIFKVTVKVKYLQLNYKLHISRVIDNKDIITVLYILNFNFKKGYLVLLVIHWKLN